MRSARHSTARIMDMMDNGELDPRWVADMCLNWLSEAEVHEMACHNDLPGFVEEDDE